MSFFTISVVIVAFKSESVILDCLSALSNSLKKFKNANVEVILVDNDFLGCHGSIDVCKSIKSLPQVKFIPSPRNGGFSFGCNLGASEASGDYLLFLNPDANVSVSFFEKIYSDPLFQRENSKLVAGFKMVSSTGSLTRNGGLLPERLCFALKKRKRSIIPSGTFLEVEDHFVDGCFWPLGAGLMLPRSLFESVSGFDERMFLTLEEPVLLAKLREYNLYFSDAEIVHEGGHSYQSSFSELQFFCSSLKKYPRISGIGFFGSILVYLKVYRILFMLFRWKIMGFFNKLN